MPVDDAMLRAIAREMAKIWDTKIADYEKDGSWFDRYKAKVEKLKAARKQRPKKRAN